MIEYFYLMKTQSINPIVFGAQIRFINAKKTKQYSRSILSAKAQCWANLTILSQLGMCIGYFPALIKKIKYIKNSIKLPS